jgi:hypothetical protein
LVTIGGKSTIVDGWAGAMLADDSAGLSAADIEGRNASNAPPAPAARQITIANSINDPFHDSLTATPAGKAESDINAPARMV